MPSENPLFRTGADSPLPKIAVRTPATLRPSSTNVPESGYESELLAWVNSAIREGDALIAVEGQLENTDENLRIAMGDQHGGGIEDPTDVRPMYRSNYTMSRMGKNINDLASAITDFRPIGEFKTYNTLYENQGIILDKLMSAWWYNNDIDLKMQLLVKDSLVKRTSYAHIVFNPTLHMGLGDLDVQIRDYKDILPIRPNSKITIQDAVGIIIKSKNTVNWGRARYPEQAAKIQANNEGALSQQWANKGQVSSPILDYLERNIPKKQTDYAIPTYDHFEIYVKDGSLNNTGAKKWIGPGPEDENPWGYWVEDGKPLYPRGRLLVVANQHAILFDGGNPYWHGMFPVVKLTLDPWAQSLLGKSAMADAKPSYKLGNEMLRGIVDACRKALKPGIIVDRQSINRMTLDQLDTSEPGFKLRTNPSAGQGIIIEPPPQLPAYVMETWAKSDQYQDHVMGVLDMRALAQLQQMSPEMDVEGLLEHLGPTVRTKGRILEVFLRELGQMMKANFFQFYTIQRRVEILGSDGMDFEDFDYDPGTLVPAFNSDQFHKAFGNEKATDEANRFKTSDGMLRTRAERAQEHIKSFNYWIAPGSLLSLAKTQDKLRYIQLFRMGVLDVITLLEKLEIPNIGELPGAPKTILERMQAAAQQGMVGAVSAAGRKASGEQMPQLRSDGKMSESG